MASTGDAADRLPAEPWCRDAAELAAELGTDLQLGLSAAEAAGRLSEHGRNELDPAEAVPTWRKLLAQFADPLIYLLLAAVAVSVVAWAVEGRGGIPFEAIVILVIVVLNAVLGYVQEARAERGGRGAATDGSGHRRRGARRTRGANPDGGARAGRSPAPGGGGRGRRRRAARGGGVAHRRRGIPTGESEPVLKLVASLPEPAALGDRVNMVFNGTAVTRGRGRAVVTATGMATEMGKVARLLGRTEQQVTPLQREVDRIGRALGVAVIVIAIVVVGAILLTAELEEASDLVDVLLVGVSLAVAAVPEGLPAVLSVVLALGVQRMARRRAIGSPRWRRSARRRWCARTRREP